MIPYELHANLKAIWEAALFHSVLINLVCALCVFDVDGMIKSDEYLIG